jgi:outer membrane murein-binding lipoprotein Lpp
MASFAPAEAPYRAPQPRLPQPARRPARPRSAPRARALVAGGVVWIIVVATLLAGIVALNVAVLRLNVQVQQLDAQRDELASKRDALQTQLSRAAAGGRVESAAVHRLGLVAPESTTYLELKRPRR